MNKIEINTINEEQFKLIFTGRWPTDMLTKYTILIMQIGCDVCDALAKLVHSIHSQLEEESQKFYVLRLSEHRIEELVKAIDPSAESHNMLVSCTLHNGVRKNLSFFDFSEKENAPELARLLKQFINEE